MALRSGRTAAAMKGVVNDAPVPYHLIPELETLADAQNQVGSKAVSWKAIKSDPRFSPYSKEKLKDTVRRRKMARKEGKYKDPPPKTAAKKVHYYFNHQTLVWVSYCSTLSEDTV